MARLMIYVVAVSLSLALIGLTSACRSPQGGLVGAKNDTGKTRDTSAMLAIGDKAPLFESVDDQGREIRLSDVLAKGNAVLIFYPANETPGCTAQLCAARDNWQRYQDAGVQVLGVNPGEVKSHRSFAAHHSLPFPLVSDHKAEIVRAYGCRGLLGITSRTVYGIDATGTIVFAERGMPPTDRILAAFGGAPVGS